MRLIVQTHTTSTYRRFRLFQKPNLDKRAWPCAPTNLSAENMMTIPWTTPLTERQKFVILIHRITFGPRPGDTSHVEEMGRSQFLEQQLHRVRVVACLMELKGDGPAGWSQSLERG